MFFHLRNKEQFMGFAADNSAFASDYPQVLPSPRSVLIPQIEGEGDAPVMAAGFLWDFRSIDAQKGHALSILFMERANGSSGFYVTCGETFLGGAFFDGADEARVRVAACKAPAGSSGLKRETLERMNACYGMAIRSDPCCFWNTVRREPESVGCRHVKHLFAALGGTLASVLTEVRAEYEAAANRPAETADSSGFEHSLVDRLAKFVRPDMQLRTPVLIDGPKGGGKTFAALAMGKGFDSVVRVECMRSMEAFDFIGGMMPTADGFVWADGPISKAFREASSGKKVLLVVDEYLRAPKHERGMFITALNNHAGFYRLCTGRPVKIEGNDCAEFENVCAPVSNLAVIATCNMGGEYDVQEDDEAGVERWLYMHHAPTERFIRQVLGDNAKRLGIADSTAMVDVLVNWHNVCDRLKDDRCIKQTPSLRILVRILEFVAQDQTANALRVAIEAQVPGLVGRDNSGRLNQGQMNAAMKAIVKVFGRSGQAIAA